MKNSITVLGLPKSGKTFLIKGFGAHSPPKETSSGIFVTTVKTEKGYELEFNEIDVFSLKNPSSTLT